MPVRNALPYLKECLESIINQTHNDWELIAINDHSTDHSYTVLRDYAGRDKRIHCYQNLGSGIIDALTTGSAYANGNFITRMDADDIMPPVKLERLKEILEKSGEGTLSTGKVKYISESELGNGFKKYETWLNNLCEENNHYQEIYRECVIPSPCWMMYKTDFDAIGGFKSSAYPEDYDLCFRMYENNIKVNPSSEILHIWRDHGRRASRNDDNYSDNRFLNLKLRYFLSIDYAPKEKLVLWGAGKKGKFIAKYLIDNHIHFEWITNNEKKIGKHIYAHLIQDSSSIHDYKVKSSILLAVANEEDQRDIIKSIESLHRSILFYKFC